LINLADCREKNRQLATAWALFLEVERQTRNDKKQAKLNKTARDRAAGIEPNLSYLTVSVPDESRVDGLVITRNGEELAAGVWNRAIPVDGGEYVISGRAPGHEEWKTTVFLAAEGGRASVDVPKFKEAPKIVTPEPGAPATPPVDDDDDDLLPVEAPGTFTTRRKVALGVGVVGVAGVVAGVVLGGQASDLEDQARTLCPGNPCARGAEANALLERGRSRAIGANLAYGVGGVAIVAAAVLWFTGGASAAESAATAVVPRLSPTYAGLDVAVRF
jgi:hypothetical protein